MSNFNYGGVFPKRDSILKIAIKIKRGCRFFDSLLMFEHCLVLK